MSFGLDVPVEHRKIADREGSITFDLEFPPSVNNLFANGSSGRFTTPAYRDWQTRAGWEVVARRPGRVGGPVKVTLQYEEKSGRRDLDNLIKPVLDLCVKHQVIDGDHQSIVREINARWSAEVKGVRVTIEPTSAVRETKFAGGARMGGRP